MRRLRSGGCSKGDECQLRYTVFDCELHGRRKVLQGCAVMELERFAKGLLGFIPRRTQLALGLRVTVSAVVALFVAHALWLAMPRRSALTAVIIDPLHV